MKRIFMAIISAVSLLFSGEIAFFSVTGTELSAVTVDETSDTNYIGGRFARIARTDKEPITAVSIIQAGGNPFESDFKCEKDSAGSFWLIPARKLDYDSVGDRTFDLSLTTSSSKGTVKTPVTISVNPKNDNPVSCPDLNYTISEGAQIPSINIKPLITDKDIPSAENRWAVTNISMPKFGSLDTSNIQNGVFGYSIQDSAKEFPADTFRISFTYYLTDYTANGYDVKRQISGPFEVTFKMVNKNDEPVYASNDTLIVTEGVPCSQTVGLAASLLANDHDLDNETDRDMDGKPDVTFPLTVKRISPEQGKFGTMQISSNGTFLYTPSAAAGIDLFQYEVTDGLHRDTAEITVRIGSVNTNSPVFTNDTIRVLQGQSVSAFADGKTILSRITDADLPDDTLRVSEASDTTAVGIYSVKADGSFTYSHNGSRIFADSLPVSVTDAAGHVTIGYFPIKVTAVVLPRLQIAVTPLNGIVPDSFTILPSMTNGVVPVPLMNTGALCDVSFSRFIDPADLKVSAVLLDVVGNTVRSTSYPAGNSEELLVSRCTSGDRIRLFWNVTNGAGRKAGAGSYLLKIQITDSYNGETAVGTAVWAIMQAPITE